MTCNFECDLGVLKQNAIKTHSHFDKFTVEIEFYESKQKDKTNEDFVNCVNGKGGFFSKPN